MVFATVYHNYLIIIYVLDASPLLSFSLLLFYIGSTFIFILLKFATQNYYKSSKYGMFCIKERIKEGKIWL